MVGTTAEPTHGCARPAERLTQSWGLAQEHEAKKDHPNVRPHLDKDQATVGFGDEHIAPGAGGMHTEARAWLRCMSMTLP